jgi:ketopantoate hydroxymethyltransferase
MVVLGYSTTQPVTMEDMLHHCKAVRRGAPNRFIVADLPFGSYESGEDEALRNSFRLIKEAGYYKKFLTKYVYISKIVFRCRCCKVGRWKNTSKNDTKNCE